MTLSEQILSDIDIFLDADEFAVAITFTPLGKSARTIYGIYDAPYEEFSPLEGAVATAARSVLVKSADVEGLLDYGGVMTIAGISYRVKGPGQPDGTGLTRVELAE